MNSPSPATSGVDPVAIWVRSQVLDEKVKSETPISNFIQKSSIAQRYDGQRSLVWTSLSEMAGPNRTALINKMIQNWPYDNERRAMIYPLHVGLLSNCLSSSIIASKINADLFLYNPKAGLLETVKKAPKSPLVFGVYTSGLLYFGFYNILIMNPFLGEETPCGSCALSRYCALMAASGVLFPTITVPALAHYVNIQRNPEIPITKNMLEFVTMLFTASKPAWKVMPKLLVMQLAVASVCTYSLLWGRDRIFNSVDADPELLKESLMKAQENDSTKTRITSLLAKIPMFRPLLDPTGENS